jgi:hypothetical protein
MENFRSENITAQWMHPRGDKCQGTTRRGTRSSNLPHLRADLWAVMSSALIQDPDVIHGQKNLPLALKHVLKLVCYRLGLLMEIGFCKPTL